MRDRGGSALRAGGVLVLLLAVLALCPPPQNPIEQVDPSSSRLRPPGTRLVELRLAGGRTLLADAVEVRGDEVRIERRGQTETIASAEIENLRDGRIDDERVYWLGSDRLGRDVWSRLMVGARISLSIGLLAVLIAITLGVAVGAAAALAPSWADGLIMRAVDALLAFPQLFLVIALAALFSPDALLVILILGGTSWMGITRLARAEMMGLLQQDFVLASRAVGQTTGGILLRHLLPNAMTPLVVAAALLIGNLILAEAALSFFGLSVQPPTPSWGNMIFDGRQTLGRAWWIAFFPGLAIALTVIGFNLIGDGLRDLLDPRRRSSDGAVETAQG